MPRGEPLWPGYMPHAPPHSPTCNRKSRIPKAMFPSISYQFCFILIVSLLAVQAFRGFRQFISLGPGGTPPNLFVYMKIVFFQVFKPRKLALNSKTGMGYLPAPLPTRLRPPPTVAGIAPQQQTTQKVGQNVQNMLEYLEALEQDRNCEIRRSELEENSKAVFVRGLEVAHVHPSDGSMHVYLSAPDCKEVIKSQWGGM